MNALYQILHRKVQVSLVNTPKWPLFEIVFSVMLQYDDSKRFIPVFPFPEMVLLSIIALLLPSKSTPCKPFPVIEQLRMEPPGLSFKWIPQPLVDDVVFSMKAPVDCSEKIPPIMEPVIVDDLTEQLADFHHHAPAFVLRLIVDRLMVTFVECEAWIMYVTFDTETFEQLAN